MNLLWRRIDMPKRRCCFTPRAALLFYAARKDLLFAAQRATAQPLPGYLSERGTRRYFYKDVALGLRSTPTISAALHSAQSVLHVALRGLRKRSARLADRRKRMALSSQLTDGAVSALNAALGTLGAASLRTFSSSAHCPQPGVSDAL
eukprot:594853-Pleurochrysis_carterae.AAC.8